MSLLTKINDIIELLHSLHTLVDYITIMLCINPQVVFWSVPVGNVHLG